jgi:hypothetical protein
MAVIKLKQRDIEDIVKTLVNEQMGDAENPLDGGEDVDNQPGVELTMMTDGNGNFFAVDLQNPNKPRIVAQTK